VPRQALPTLKILDTEMAYRAAGSSGPVVLLLHGNPTSSFIWRRIIAGLEGAARCIAPDLVGFGQSGKPPIEYRFADHARYLDAFLDAMEIDNAYVVAQDWGTALAFDLGARRPDFVTGLAFMEFIRPFQSWADFHQADAARETFQRFRMPGRGEEMIMRDNLFVERVLPNSIVRTLSDDEMDAYREPFPTPESRRPIWRLPNELPIEGQPADTWQRLTAAHEALRAAAYPKLLFVGDPGALVSPAFAASFADQLSDCRVVHLGPGKHYLQEDHPERIAREIRTELEARNFQ